MVRVGYRGYEQVGWDRLGSKLVGRVPYEYEYGTTCRPGIFTRYVLPLRVGSRDAARPAQAGLSYNGVWSMVRDSTSISYRTRPAAGRRPVDQLDPWALADQFDHMYPCFFNISSRR